MSLRLVLTGTTSVAIVAFPAGVISGVEAFIYAVNLSKKIDG